ncbi:hypothetical protein K490DRAFT_63309 [Saccharata proteae CBS 121410]|uniref:Uncharacterized protein n=1 Tax=Saccharata proteae CBS 121410 TaxID=1314787 RepID=A0A9P4M202_9PEZI|nr:hypothetical protein K490DRAFT_63309 [Saccharata proteae CBS 121410]
MYLPTNTNPVGSKQSPLVASRQVTSQEPIGPVATSVASHARAIQRRGIVYKPRDDYERHLKALTWTSFTVGLLLLLGLLYALYRLWRHRKQRKAAEAKSNLPMAERPPVPVVPPPSAQYNSPDRAATTEAPAVQNPGVPDDRAHLDGVREQQQQLERLEALAGPRPPLPGLKVWVRYHGLFLPRWCHFLTHTILVVGGSVGFVFCIRAFRNSRV